MRELPERIPTPGLRDSRLQCVRERSISLPATTDCDASGAIRMNDGRKLSSSSSATEAGGGLHGGTLAFADDESTTKTIEVAVLEDTHDEGEKTLTPRLSTASGGRVTCGATTGPRTRT